VFTILTGLGRITNMISMTSVDVPAGYTVLSDPSGRLHLRLATDDERAEAARAASLTEEERHLRLQFKNRTGETRDIIIDMKQ